jgi:hypothetical protein
MDLFTFTTRDGWGRPVRRLDHNALAVAILGASIGAGLLVFHPYVIGGAKLAHRLATSF